MSSASPSRPAYSGHIAEQLGLQSDRRILVGGQPRDCAQLDMFCLTERHAVSARSRQ
jgi:hypothetical protein